MKTQANPKDARKGTMKLPRQGDLYQVIMEPNFHSLLESRCCYEKMPARQHAKTQKVTTQKQRMKTIINIDQFIVGLNAVVPIQSPASHSAVEFTPSTEISNSGRSTNLEKHDLRAVRPSVS